jgi:hypothetical protein
MQDERSELREGYADIGDHASHWVHHDEAERVTRLLADFFAPALPTANR